MIQFNELRITPNGKYLLIDVSVEDKEYYENVTIDRIVIDTQDTYIPNGPSSNAIYTYVVDSTHNPKYPYPDDKIKSVQLCLSTEDLKVDLSKTLFFVYAIADGIPSPYTPCGMDNEVIMSPVCDLYTAYQGAMNYIKEIEKECSIPTTFIEFILRVKAFMLSIKTGNYLQAIKYWNKFFKDRNSKTIKTCGCNG